MPKPVKFGVVATTEDMIVIKFPPPKDNAEESMKDQPLLLRVFRDHMEMDVRTKIIEVINDEPTFSAKKRKKTRKFYWQDLLLMNATLNIITRPKRKHP